MPGTTETAESASETRSGGAEEEIELQVLAEKVYNLLKEEARIERERLGPRSTG